MITNPPLETQLYTGDYILALSCLDSKLIKEGLRKKQNKPLAIAEKFISKVETATKINRRGSSFPMHMVNKDSKQGFEENKTTIDKVEVLMMEMKLRIDKIKDEISDSTVRNNEYIQKFEELQRRLDE